MQALLSVFINKIAGFMPSDYNHPAKSVFNCSAVHFPRRAFHFEKLSSEMTTRIRQACYNYFLISRLDVSLGENETQYLELGLARIQKRGTLQQPITVIDEPLVLLSCAMWFNSNTSDTLYKNLADSIGNHNASTGRNGFEEFISFYLLNIFRKPTLLNEVFDFTGADGIVNDGGLGCKKATIVALHKITGLELGEAKISLRKGNQTSEIFGPVGLSISQPGNGGLTSLIEWLEFKKHAAFCFPMNSMGPDIMCFLKVEQDPDNPDDYTYVCLAMQCKYYQSDSSLNPFTLKKAVATITPKEFFQPRTAVVSNSGPSIVADI